MSLGLIWFTLADSTVAPNFNLTGKDILHFRVQQNTWFSQEQFHRSSESSWWSAFRYHIENACFIAALQQQNSVCGRRGLYFKC